MQCTCIAHINSFLEFRLNVVSGQYAINTIKQELLAGLHLGESEA